MLKRIVFVVCFLAGACASTTSTLPEMRMTPAEVRSGGSGEGQIGSSKLADVHTRVLFGDPAKAGFYSILLGGYPLDSPRPYRLWFAFGLPEVRVNYPVMGNRIDGHSLLRQAKEEVASTL